MSNQISHSRWHIKKISRKAMVLATYFPVRLIEAITRQTETKIRSLTYHRFGDNQYDPFCVDLKDFEDQMKWLAEQKIAVSLNDVEDFIYGNKNIQKNSVLVTIDDGYRSTFTHALPILRHYKIPSVAFISAGILDGTLKKNGQIEPYLTMKEIKQLTNEGVTIGSHSYSHCSVAKADISKAKYEAQISRKLLEQHIEQPVTSFAYPFGTKTDFNQDTANILRGNGYKTVFTSQHGSINFGMNPFELPRIKVEGGEPQWMFRMLCQGGMDAWRLVDNILFQLQKPNQ